MAVRDCDTRHRRRWWRLERLCAGCAQPWPCFVVMQARARRWGWL